MPWAAAAAVAGAALSSYSSNKASKRQQSAEYEAIASQERMFDKQLELMEPYRKAGYSAIEGLSGLTTPEGRQKMLADYYQSPEYQMMQGQASEQAARYGAATGGLRSGSTYMALENVAPRLGQNYLSNQYNQMTGLANLGMGAASQGVQGAQNLGMAQAQGLRGAGEAYAQGQMAQANIFGDLMSNLAGMYAGGQFGGS